MGKNLLKNSDNLLLWLKESSVTVTEEEQYYHIVTSNTGGGRYGIYQDIELDPTHTYQLTFESKYGYSYGVIPGASYGWTTTEANITFDGEAIVKKEIVPSEGKNKLRVYFYDVGNTAAPTYVRNPKLIDLTTWGGAEMIAYGQFTLSNMDGGIEYIVGTQTAATGSWTGVSEDAALVTGKTISYKLPYAGSGNASLTLTLADGTNTDAIAVYLNTTRVTTHFGAGSVIQMTYDGTYWRATAIPNSNNYDRINHANSVKAATAITAARVIAGNSSGYNNVAAGIVHDISYPILYAPSAITTTGTTTYEAYPSVNFSSTHAIEGGVAYSTLFLVGTVSGKDFTIVDPVFTCNTPTTEDGKYYIPLGLLYSATNGYFSPVKELWCYKIVGKDDNGQDIGMFGSLATISEYLAISAQEEADKAVAGNLETDARLTVYKSSLDNTNSELTSVKSKVEAFDGEFADYKDTVSSALSQQADSLTATFNRQVESMNEVLTNNSQVLEQLETYIRASTSGLELGASNSSIKAVLSNDRLSFMDGDTEVAYISNNNFYITAGTVTQSIQVGEHKWLAKSTGHMTLVWVKE